MPTPKDVKFGSCVGGAGIGPLCLLCIEHLKAWELASLTSAYLGQIMDTDLAKYIIQLY